MICGIRTAALAGLALLTGSGAVAAQDVPERMPTRFAEYALTAEWLQLGGGGLNRDALPSYEWSLSREIGHQGLRIEVGYLRAARPTTTAKGVSAGIALSKTRGRFTLRPSIAALAGVAETVADSDGYHWRAEGGVSEGGYPDGETGYQGRARYTRGTTIGGGLSLAAEARLIAGLSVVGSTRYWVFSGNVLRSDRTRLLAGFGLAVRPADFVAAFRRKRPGPLAATTETQETSK
jgi:hypothetical protein